MRPGIVAATLAEARILTKGPISTEALIQLPNFFLVVSGMGAQRAGRAAEMLLEGGARGLISWGTAGALRPGISCGTLMLPDCILAADGTFFPADPIWQGALAARLGQIVLQKGVLAESRKPLGRRSEKARFAENAGAAAVDMESAAVGRAARERGIPFLAIRVIMDEAESEISDRILTCLDEFGRIRISRLSFLLARHPGEMLRLLRLRREFETARSTLVHVARQARNRFEIAAAMGACRPGSGRNP